MSSQKPLEEVAERVAEAAPGLVAAAHLVALDDWRKSQRDHRQRVRDDHVLQKKALGADVSAEQEEPVGNLVITGDIFGNNADRIVNALAGGTPAPAATTSTTTTPAAETGSVGTTATTTAATPPAAGFTWGKAALLAAAILGGAGMGAGIPWLAGAYSGSTTNISGNELGVGLEVTPGGAE